MPRIRTIKPEAPQDAKLAKVSRETRLTFWYLLTQADDQGYFRAAPRTLLGALYPHDPDVTERVLTSEMDSLLAIGVLRCFDSPDGPVGQITNFARHQKIDHPSTPTLAKLARTPRDSFAKGVLSLDLGEGVGANSTSPRAREAVADEAPAIAELRALWPSWYEPDLDSALAKSPSPESVARAIRAIGPGGIHELKGATWEAIGCALQELLATGGGFNPAGLRAFTQRLVAGDGPRGELSADERHVVDLVCAYHGRELELTDQLLTPQREAMLAARYRESHDVSELLFAVDGLARNPWARQHGKCQLEDLFRTRGELERHARAAGYRPGRVHTAANAPIAGVA